MTDPLNELIRNSKIDFTNTDIAILQDVYYNIIFQRSRSKKKSVLEVTPKEYLEFAKKDLLESDNRARINAVSNAKRAIDCNIDEILINLKLEKSEIRKI